MICTSRLIFIVTYFGLVFVTTAIPKQEKTSLWDVYEYEGSYSGDKRGFYIAYWELTEEDLEEVNVQKLLNKIMEINYVHNVRNSGIDWEWEYTTENGTVWTDHRGRFDDQINYVCQDIFDGPMECIGTHGPHGTHVSNSILKEVYGFVEDGLNIELWMNDIFYYVLHLKLQGKN